MKGNRKTNDKAKTAFKSLFKWGDIILVLILVVAVVLTIVLATAHKAQYAEVYVDGNLKYTLDLSVDNTIEILDGKMTLRVQDGKVFVGHSDCAEQLCVHSSPIGKDGGMIVCLPNKVVIKTVSKKVDAIT